MIDRTIARASVGDETITVTHVARSGGYYVVTRKRKKERRDEAEERLHTDYGAAVANFSEWCVAELKRVRPEMKGESK